MTRFIFILFLVCIEQHNISLRFQFLFIEFSRNMILRWLSQCRTGRHFSIRLLIFRNIALYVIANRIRSLNCCLGFIYLASALNNLEISLKSNCLSVYLSICYVKCSILFPHCYNFSIHTLQIKYSYNENI